MGLPRCSFHLGTGLGWECIAIAPSYPAFISLAGEDAVGWAHPDNWGNPVRGGVPEPALLLEAAELLSGEPVSVVSVDMPLSNTPITGRRECDNVVSRNFGGKGCGTHSPINGRPGEISVQLRELLAGLVLQRQFREGCGVMPAWRRGAWHGSVWPVRYCPAYPQATAATRLARTVPGAAFPAPQLV